MTPSAVYKLTLSPAVAALVEQHRGALSVQEFAIVAMLEKCQGSPSERVLRDEIERLHATLARVLANPGAPQQTTLQQPQMIVGAERARVEQLTASDKLDWW